MTISTYTELKTALGVGGWPANAATSGHEDEFIDNAEAAFNRRLRIRAMEATTTGNFGATASVSVPSGFLEMRTFSYTPMAGAVQNLVYKTPEQIAALELAYAGPPNFWTLANGEIQVERVPDDTYAYSMTYYKAIPALSGSTATNAILTNWPDAYLAGTMYYAHLFLQDFDKAGNWKSIFEQHLAEIQRADAREKPQPEAFFDLPMSARSGGSIFTG